MKLNAKSILVLVICFILSTAITLQLRTMASEDAIASGTFGNGELRDSLLKAEERYKSMQTQLSESTKELEKIRKATTKEGATDKNDELSRNNMILGLTDVTGPGIVITAKDGTPSGAATDNMSLFLIHDADLREIIAELWNAGAQAISVDDQRIVSSTCIMCAGNIISINNEKVNSPFVIKAIGNQESLYGIDRPGGYIQYMKAYTSVDLKKADSVEIPKFEGAISQKYISEVKE